MVNHAYWNLDKIKKDIFDHHVQINSNQYLENDSENIPTGRVMNVKGTRFDFKKSTRIRDKFTNKFKGFDENFIIKKILSLQLKYNHQKAIYP